MDLAQKSVGATLHGDTVGATPTAGLFAARPRLLLATMLVLLALAAGIRIDRIDSPFPGLLVDREYRMAIIARASYFQTTEVLPEWRKQAALAAAEREGTLEPPLMELLAATAYRILGKEDIWIARLFSTAFWLTSGAFLFLIARRISGEDAAVFSTAYYLFVPLGLSASGSFQPDALMMALFLLSIVLLLRYHDQPSALRLVAAASVAGLTLFVRPLVLFATFAAFVALETQRKGSWRNLFGLHAFVFTVVSLAPMAAFYGYGILIAGFLRGQVEMSFTPHLYLAKEYWRNWLMIGSSAVGPAVLLTGLVGLPLLRKGRPRVLLVGLWVGYLVFGLVFNHHIHTHPYYQLQLIAIVALSMSPVFAVISRHLSEDCTDWRWWVPPVAAVVLIGAVTLTEARNGVDHRRYESPQTAWEIGEIVNHSTNVAFLSPFYGRPLMYFGELAGNYWPRSITSGLYARPGDREKSVQERWNALGASPDYFIITDFPEYEAHHTDLKDFLKDNCPIVANTSRYLIYGACTN